MIKETIGEVLKDHPYLIGAYYKEQEKVGNVADNTVRYDASEGSGGFIWGKYGELVNWGEALSAYNKLPRQLDKWEKILRDKTSAPKEYPYLEDMYLRKKVKSTIQENFEKEFNTL